MNGYEDVKATCTECGNPVYLLLRDKKLVCSVGMASKSGYIPLNERCFEKTDMPRVEDL